jgi:hypothetical protein
MVAFPYNNFGSNRLESQTKMIIPLEGDKIKFEGEYQNLDGLDDLEKFISRIVSDVSKRFFPTIVDLVNSYNNRKSFL